MTRSKVFRAVVTGPEHRWHVVPFDLKFDGNWTHQPGSRVTMDRAGDIRLLVEDAEAAVISGMRFATGQEWMKHAGGYNVRVKLITKVESGAPLDYRTAYVPQDRPRSEFFVGTATETESTLTFDFEIPAGSEANTHLVMIEPQAENVELVICEAELEIL